LIWYETLRSPSLKRFAQFRSFAQLTVSIAQQLFPGASSPEAQAVQQAWADVGIVI
jgi:Zn-dependent metalloprotease